MARELPETRYASVGDLRIAYQTVGEGPVDVVLSAGTFNHTDVQWEDPAAALFFRRLATFSRLIRFDLLGASGSDRVPPGQRPPAFPDQLDAVLAAAGARSVALIAALDAGPGAIQYVTENRDRVSHLVLYNSAARFTQATGYEIGLDEDAVDRLLPLFEGGWASGPWTELSVPSRASDASFSAWYAKYLRAIGTPTEVRETIRSVLALDVRDLLARVDVPTLVLHRQDYALVSLDQGRYLADRIDGAELVVLPGADGPLFWETPDQILFEIEQFVRGSIKGSYRPGTVLTLLFTDIVRSTERLHQLGDRDWATVLAEHDAITSRWVAAFDGDLVKRTGDGVLAVFGSPSQAVRCAEAIRDELAGMSVGLRSGIHAGEVVRADDGDVTGIAVNVAARIMQEAHEGEILVSNTVRGLVAGSPIEFQRAGAYELKGIDESWELHRAVGQEEHAPGSSA